MTITEQLRTAIANSGMTYRELGRRADVPHASISRFVRRDRDLRGEQIDRLCAALNLRLSTRRRVSP